MIVSVIVVILDDFLSLSISLCLSMFIFCKHTNWCAVELNSTIVRIYVAAAATMRDEWVVAWTCKAREQECVGPFLARAEICVWRVAAIKVRWTKAFDVCPWSSGTRYETVPSLILWHYKRRVEKITCSYDWALTRFFFVYYFFFHFGSVRIRPYECFESNLLSNPNEIERLSK